MSTYTPSAERYNTMKYARCGASSLRLPKISLGLWHNFGTYDSYDKARDMVLHSFDRGVTHFDLANNYGPEPGSAEVTFGKILANDLKPYRDELIIASKAGHDMWSGPYGGNSSRKSIMASADQSLKRMGLDYFDIFYTHRYDGDTPIEETAQALVDLVRSGKALYVGVSKYPPREAARIFELLKEAKTPCLVTQYRYSMFVREIESSALPLVAAHGAGMIAFSPLAQGMLSGRYLDGVPEGSRVAKGSQFLTTDSLTSDKMATIRALNDIAAERGETLAQMALAWALRDERMTSLMIGASSVAQIDENLAAIDAAPFSSDELARIDALTLY